MTIAELALIKLSEISKEIEVIQRLMHNSIDENRAKKADTKKAINKFLSKPKKL